MGIGLYGRLPNKLLIVQRPLNIMDSGVLDLS